MKTQALLNYIQKHPLSSSIDIATQFDVTSTSAATDLLYHTKIGNLQRVRAGKRFVYQLSSRGKHHLKDLNAKRKEQSTTPEVPSTPVQADAGIPSRDDMQRMINEAVTHAMSVLFQLPVRRDEHHQTA